MSKTNTKAFIHCEQLEQYPYPESCPFKTARAGMVRQMLLSQGLLTGADKIEVAPVAATDEALRAFHTDAYLQAMRQANAGDFSAEMLHMQLGTSDCPVFKGMYEYATLAVGATMTGAQLIADGKAKVAFNPLMWC
jgi:acetoin utilization protein AcuC